MGEGGERASNKRGRRGLRVKAVILANGEFPKGKALLRELENAEFLAVCDGAMIHLERLGIIPQVIIGDLDSLPLELKTKYKNQVVQLKEQASNDLSKAFFHCIGLGFDEFVILGATGKREDHSIANISLLSEYAKHCKDLVMKSDFGEFRIYSLPCEIPSQRGEQISLFCLNPEAKITSKHLKYPLVDLELKIWANGTLNQAEGDFFTLSADRQAQIIVYKEKRNFQSLLIDFA